jgi:hypothetical protein
MENLSIDVGIIPEAVKSKLLSDPELNKTLSLEIRVSIAGTVISVLEIPSPACPTALFIPDLLASLEKGSTCRLLAYLFNKGWHITPNKKIKNIIAL